MCYSAGVSLFTFTIGFGFSALLVFSKEKFHRLLGWFLGFVSVMQLIEYLLWQHPICDNYNKTVSVIGMALNHAQPIVLAALTGLFYQRQLPVLAALSAFYLSAIIPYSAQFTSDLRCSTRCGATDPHLVWNWNSMKGNELVYSIFLGTFVGVALVGMPADAGGLFAFASVLTYGLSSLIYERKVMGSLWCFWTAFFPAAIYLAERAGLTGSGALSLIF